MVNKTWRGQKEIEMRTQVTELALKEGVTLSSEAQYLSLNPVENTPEAKMGALAHSVGRGAAPDSESKQGRCKHHPCHAGLTPGVPSKEPQSWALEVTLLDPFTLKTKQQRRELGMSNFHEFASLLNQGALSQ